MSSDGFKIYNRSLCLDGFKELVETLGGDPEGLALQAGLPSEALTTPQCIINHYSMVRAMELAAEKLDEPSFGLRMIMESPEHAANLCPHLHLARLVRNIEDWYDLGVRYWSYFTNSSTSVLIKRPDAGQAIIRLVELSPEVLAPQYTDYAMAMAVKLVRIGADSPEIQPDCLRLRRSAPSDTSLFDGFFGCDVEFGAEHDELVLDVRLLNLKTRRDFKTMRRVADMYMQFAMARVRGPQRSLVEAVSQVILALLPTGTCSVQIVAQIIGISPKKLQRNLAVEGTSYSDLLDLCREETARKLLIETQVQIEQIAGLLGYAGGPPFAAAFNRWTGMSPRQYRKDHSGG